MTHEERDKYVKDFLETHCYPVMTNKGKEYCGGAVDANNNFKEISKITGLDPLTVCYIYAAKHWLSISNYVKNRNTPSGEPIEGRLGDMLNYILILGSLIKEETNASVPSSTLLQ